MATSLSAIRDQLKAVIEAAVPSTAPVDEYFRYKPSNAESIEEFAASAPGSSFRKFSIIRSSDTDDGAGNILDPTEVQRVDEQVTITVAYPRLPDIYGEGYESMEDCMRADARQIRDLCVSPSTLISGWSAVTGVVIHAPDRDGDVWFQRLTVSLSYCESQTIS